MPNSYSLCSPQVRVDRLHTMVDGTFRGDDSKSILSPPCGCLKLLRLDNSNPTSQTDLFGLHTPSVRYYRRLNHTDEARLVSRIRQILDQSPTLTTTLEPPSDPYSPKIDAALGLSRYSTPPYLHRVVPSMIKSSGSRSNLQVHDRRSTFHEWCRSLAFECLRQRSVRSHPECNRSYHNYWWSQLLALFW